MIVRQTSLSANVIQFCRFLRHKGFTVGVERGGYSVAGIAVYRLYASGTFQTGIKGDTLQK